MAPKRLRIFAGPNGSGKSTYIRNFNFPHLPNLKLGVYVNADDIEKQLKQDYWLPLDPYKIKISTQTIQDHFKKSTFAPKKLDDDNLWSNFFVEEDKIKVKTELAINSYIAADIAEFIRQQLVLIGESFSFETVMSDSNKISFLHFAKEKGYKIYLYFFTTKDPEINKNRVDIRVKQSGHNVNHTTIEKRYYKSLDNLKDAVLASDRAYLFDTTGYSIIIAEITGGKKVEVFDENNVPEWFMKYLVEK